MNQYTCQFVAACPNNDEPIIYQLVIQTDRTIMVEHIVTATKIIRKGFHEKIADGLHAQFPGVQTLTAHHHGVDIKTTRGVA